MKNVETPSYSLNHFQGSLDLLWQLIQNGELDILDLNVRELIDQFLTFDPQEEPLDRGSEFIHWSSHLLFQKSKALLPAYEQKPEEDEELDPRFEVIHKLVEYCRFKQAARGLVELESQQPGFFFRGGVGGTTQQKPLGVEHLSLSDLASLFQQIASKAVSSTRIIQEEVWKVSDKITLILRRIQTEQEISFFDLFSSRLCKEELIVIFLAVLELMKMGKIVVLKLTESQQIVIRGFDV